MIKEYVLENDFIKLTMLNVGCVIKSYIYKPLNKELVVGLENNEDYLTDPVGIGCSIVGPFAGRIENASYEINNQKVKLSRNYHEKHHIHGGDNPLSVHFFDVEELKNCLVFTTTINNSSTNFKDLEIKSTFKLNENELINEINATSIDDVVFNPTNHTYYNFNAEKNILDYKLDFDFKSVYYLDEDSIVKRKVSKEESIFKDLTKSKIKDNYISHEQFDKTIFIDHPFELKTKDITLSNEELKLTINTTSDYLVIYCGNNLDTFDLKMNIRPEKHMAICLETQEVPNAINIDEEKEKVIVNKNKPFYKKDVYIVNEIS